MMLELEAMNGTVYILDGERLAIVVCSEYVYNGDNGSTFSFAAFHPEAERQRHCTRSRRVLCDLRLFTFIHCLRTQFCTSLMRVCGDVVRRRQRRDVRDGLVDEQRQAARARGSSANLVG